MNLFELRITYFTMNPEVKDDLVHTEIICGEWDTKHYARLASKALNVREVIAISCITGEIVFLSDGQTVEIG